MAKRWKKEETEYLKRYASSKNLEELARRFDIEPSEVEAKLSELGLEPSGGASDGLGDPLFAVYREAVEKLYEEDWPAAAELFERILEEGDTPELSERARQMLTLCQRRQANGGEEEGDPFLRAVMQKNEGNLDAAMEICENKGNAKQERFIYLKASLLALRGEKREAAELLSRAVEMNPKNRAYAFHDADFEEVRRQPEFAAIFELP